MTIKHMSILALLATLTGCNARPDGSDEGVEGADGAEPTGEAESALRANAVEVDYYSDATLTNLVGYKIYGCNGTTTWGVHTSYIEVDELYSCQSGGYGGGGSVGCYDGGFCDAQYSYCVAC